MNLSIHRLSTPIYRISWVFHEKRLFFALFKLSISSGPLYKALFTNLLQKDPGDLFKQLRTMAYRYCIVKQQETPYCARAPTKKSVDAGPVKCV